jgi:hypothetical protein
VQTRLQKVLLLHFSLLLLLSPDQTRRTFSGAMAESKIGDRVYG